MQGWALRTGMQHRKASMGKASMGKKESSLEQGKRSFPPSESIQNMDYLPAAAGYQPGVAAPLRLLQQADSGMHEPAGHGSGRQQQGRTEQEGLKTKLEEEQARARLLYEEIERRGFAAGEASARAQSLEAMRVGEQGLRSAIQAFEQAGRESLARIEPAVVALSLEIAHKILGHEAQLDPLLLAGAVRSAIDQMHPATAVVLVVPVADEPRWQSFLARTPELAGRIRVESDPALLPGSCLCRSGLSSRDLSVPAQMEEIAGRFKELLAANRGEREATLPRPVTPVPLKPEPVISVGSIQEPAHA